jgi:hypothetical protein
MSTRHATKIAGALINSQPWSCMEGQFSRGRVSLLAHCNTDQDTSCHLPRAKQIRRKLTPIRAEGVRLEHALCCDGRTTVPIGQLVQRQLYELSWTSFSRSACAIRGIRFSLG